MSGCIPGAAQAWAWRGDTGAEFLGGRGGRLLSRPSCPPAVRVASLGPRLHGSHSGRETAGPAAHLSAALPHPPLPPGGPGRGWRPCGHGGPGAPWLSPNKELRTVWFSKWVPCPRQTLGVEMAGGGVGGEGEGRGVVKENSSSFQEVATNLAAQPSAQLTSLPHPNFAPQRGKAVRIGPFLMETAVETEPSSSRYTALGSECFTDGVICSRDTPRLCLLPESRRNRILI